VARAESAVGWMGCVEALAGVIATSARLHTSRESTEFARPASSSAISASRNSPDNFGHRSMSRSTNQWSTRTSPGPVGRPLNRAHLPR
jgi:hypothetical protein